MRRIRHILLAAVLLISSMVFGQRTYRSTSVLASGSWYKLAVSGEGIYKIDVPFLQSLGVQTTNLSSSTIRLFGNGGALLPESNAVARPDDLTENAIFMVDGGDGIFNGSDYFLFYASGPHVWDKDSVSQKFRHRQNLYSEQSYFFITIGGSGSRITSTTSTGTPNVLVDRFLDRFFYEKDSVNLLQSGKEWLGDEMANMPGKSVSRNFTIRCPNRITTEPIRFFSDAVARSVGSSSNLNVSVNGTQILTHGFSPVGTGTYDPVAVAGLVSNSISLSQEDLNIQYNFVPGSVNAQAWINWFELFVKRKLDLTGSDQLFFRDWESVGSSRIAEYRIQNVPAGAMVWDLTDPLTPVQISGGFDGTTYTFTRDASRLREYVVFKNANFLTPRTIGPVSNQNLHGLGFMDYIIVTHPLFSSEAERLAQWHRTTQNLRTVVVTTDQIFNEFASGSPDPSAIRDFLKMFYDRAGNNPENKPRYLLLMGDASYDYKNRLANNTSFVPCFESPQSLDPLTSYTSDDFFGFLDDTEDVNKSVPLPLLDIGIGRIPCRTLKEATNVVNKIIAYHQPAAFGPWRRELTLVADDEDFNMHLNDAEFHASVVENRPDFQIQKIYLDAFRQQSGSGGSRYPDVNQAINNKIFNGTLIWNYSGHGGYIRLAEEAVLDNNMINSWKNENKLPLFITATCDFAPYDIPAFSSIGEDLLLREKTGAIALMTTTRVVFAFSNRIINNAYFKEALRTNPDGTYPSLGEAVQRTKNTTYQNFGDIINNRKFTLLGDPAMHIGFPTLRVKTTSINNVAMGSDTLKALQRYEITGEVTDVNGNRQNAFNGFVYPAIYDKPQILKTRGNDPESQVVDFRVQQNVLFKGKANVVNGTFRYAFVVPSDINFSYGRGKISYYAENGQTGASGADTTVVVGGISGEQFSDSIGPRIKAYLNDDRFVSGGITNQAPVLYLKLFDSSGINTVGSGIGHDITAQLDDDVNSFFVLNDYYESDADSYQSGVVRFQLPALREGTHTLKIKAWDVLNNSSTRELNFRVTKDEQLQLDHLYNYPNPFTSRTTFMFEHNRPGENLQVTLRIFTVAGKLVKSFYRTINNPGNRSFEIEWDGRDDFGQKAGRGVYLYQLDVKDQQGKSRSERQKLVLL